MMYCSWKDKEDVWWMKKLFNKKKKRDAMHLHCANVLYQGMLNIKADGDTLVIWISNFIERAPRFLASQGESNPADFARVVYWHCYHATVGRLVSIQASGHAGCALG